jgi:glycosyltransferase involved in cell wall biosynthesis
MNDLTLIIPAKNESESLPLVIDDLKKLNCKIKVSLKINDTDTINSIKDKDIEIFYQSGMGYGNSLREAISSCNTKYFCIFNADGSFEKNDLFQMHKLIQKNDFIYTTRYELKGGSEDDTIITYIGNKIFSKLGNILFSLKISDILYTYIMGNTSSYKSLKIQSEDFRFCVELPIKMQVSLMKYECLPSYEKKRIAGKKKVNAFIDGFLILFEMIKLFISYKIFRNKIIN